MNKIDVKRFGIASGIVGAIVYTACILVVLILGKDALVKIANILFHGMDFTNIIRMDIPVFESILGIFISFIFWGIIGGLISFFYNNFK